MTYKNLLIKKALESDILKELSVSNTKEELKKLFNNCLEAFNENDDLSPENGYLLTIATLIFRNRLNDDSYYYSNFDEDVFDDLWKMIDDLHLNQTEMIKWIPEIFNECSYVYQYQIIHKFFSKVFTGNQYQEYLKKIEPIMFSFDEWFEVITQFDSSADAEAALIKQFSSDTNLDRFQGIIYGTEWRIEFLQEVLEYCEKNDMLSVKHHCWKIIASEAVWGMNSEWLVNQYGYDYFFGPNKILFEEEFLDEAIRALDYGKAWEIDFDFDKFTQSKNLKTFLQKRKNLRTKEILDDIENKTSHGWELMYRLGDVFKKDPELIKSNDKIWKFFINLPQSILKALKDGAIKGDNWSYKVNYIESFDCWKDAAPEFKKFHAEKSSEEQLLSKLLDYLSDADARYSGMIDRLEEIGFDNFITKTHEEFRDHFVNGSWKNTCEPFDVYFPSEYGDEDGFYNDKEEWISFGEWCGANEW
tara:strand:+ start:1538 stop:2956 length:1419 start_codon:yes stop_codon:yes gene_type:complete